MEILAAIDGTGHSAAVLDTAARLGGVLSASIRPTAPEAAAVLRALEDDDVVMTVVGPGEPALAIATGAAKDVVVVPSQPSPPDSSWRPTVVVPLDGDPMTARALGHDLRALAAHGVDIVALHVFVPAGAPLYWDHFEEDYLAWERDFIRRNVAVPGGRLRVARGPVAAAAVDLATKEQALLIAVAWSQDLSPGRAGVVADLLRISPIPLLLVPARRAGAPSPQRAGATSG